MAFHNAIVHWEKPGLLGEMVASRAEVGKTQEHPGASCARKQVIIQKTMETCQKDTDTSSKGLLLTPSGTI